MNCILKNASSSSVAATVGLFLSAIGAEAADGRIDNHRDAMNQHFEVATKLYGDDRVQLHSRREGDDGVLHSVHNFDCVNKTYNSVFEDAIQPRSFPIDGNGGVMNPIQEDSAVAPLAQHACMKHGHPLLEW